jgi:hypothetical protein
VVVAIASSAASAATAALRGPVILLASVIGWAAAPAAGRGASPVDFAASASACATSGPSSDQAVGVPEFAPELAPELPLELTGVFESFAARLPSPPGNGTAIGGGGSLGTVTAKERCVRPCAFPQAATAA